MDPFEVRMQFLGLLRRLNASQQSIQKVVSFAIKFFPPCGEDLWDCVVEECQKGSINSRINILYFLDSLCETCLLVKSHASTIGYDQQHKSSSSNRYVDFVQRDLSKIVEYVVPEGRQGLPNLSSTKQVLESWRSKRVIDPQVIDNIMGQLDTRRFDSSAGAAAETSTATSSRSSTTHLPRGEIFKRIEEDRERHKRLRERRWVQPISFTPLALASFLPLDEPEATSSDKNGPLPIDVEFENDWETTSDWNEDDDEAAMEENDLCFPPEGEVAMDLS
ncbi:CTD kinase subunit gamma [Pleurotus pulmonarius]